MTEQDELQEMLRLLNQAEQRKPAKILLAEHADKIKSGSLKECACKKLVDSSKFPVLHTGAIQVRNNVCPGCKEGEKLDKELARFVCGKCKEVMMRVYQHVDRVTGFKLEAGKTYHTDQCSVCNPEIKEAKILEMIIYIKKFTKRKV